METFIAELKALLAKRPVPAVDVLDLCSAYISNEEWYQALSKSDRAHFLAMCQWVKATYEQVMEMEA